MPQQQPQQWHRNAGWFFTLSIEKTSFSSFERCATSFISALDISRPMPRRTR